MEIIPAIEKKVSKIYPLELKPQTELMEEVKIVEIKIHVRIIEPEVGTKPLVVVHVKITKTFVK